MSSANIATLLMSVVQKYGLSASVVILEKYVPGIPIPIAKIHVMEIKIALVLLVIVFAFMGSTIAMNLSTEMSTRLAIDTVYETYVTNILSLHIVIESSLKVIEGSNTEYVFLKYSTQ